MRKVISAVLGAALLAGAGQAQPARRPPAPAPPAPGDWPRYARDLQGTRFSPLDQINTGNVAQLQQAWRLRLRPEGGAGLLGGTVPIVVDGTMYLPIGNAVIALDPVTGREIWRHPVEGLVRRAVSYWPGEGKLKARLFYSTGDKITALSVKTGEVDASFADHGTLTIDGTPYPYPPTIYKNVMVIGASTAEMPRGPSGDSRAYDALTGKKLWQFHTVPQPGEVGHETWLDDGWQGRSGTNMWIWYTTVDPATDTIYMTIGGPSPNYYGGDRPGNNLFGNSIVAVDAATGKFKWHFQTIHHDLFDWDLPAPPVLFDVHKDGKVIPALAETGKPGLMFILNRETGEPIHGVTEQLVAHADVPGEWYPKSQPIPVKPAALNRMRWTPEDVVSGADTAPEHAAACRKLLDSYGGTFFNSGPFTPFFLHTPGDAPRASINMPHNGGSVWGGSAADPARGIVYVNVSESGSIGWIEKRDPKGEYGRGTDASTQAYDRGSLVGPGAYSAFQASFKTPEGQTLTLPCIKPPWGRLMAVDANSGEILWASRLGITEGLPKDKQLTGSNNGSGGPIVTAGGLVFIGATGDRFLRAFDSANGTVLWEKQLDYAPMTLPITYRGKEGRQYVAVIAVGAGLGGSGARGPDGKPLNGESLIAFALPK
ncbi:MAG: PQQ-binding-like beta-propeller repeat protein [Croceibacterium sp.]